MSTTTVADRFATLSADDKLLARRIVRARQAQAQLAELAPRIDDLTEQVASAQERHDAAKATQQRIVKERKTLKNRLFSGSLAKRAQTTELQYATLQEVDAWRDLEAARGQLATARHEKTALDKDVQLLRAGDAATQTRITALLAAVFDGPTPDFPYEDRLEEQVRVAQSNDADAAKERSDALTDLQQQLKDLRENILEEVTSEPL